MLLNVKYVAPGAEPFLIQGQDLNSCKRGLLCDIWSQDHNLNKLGRDPKVSLHIKCQCFRSVVSDQKNFGVFIPKIYFSLFDLVMQLTGDASFLYITPM